MAHNKWEFRLYGNLCHLSEHAHVIEISGDCESVIGDCDISGNGWIEEVRGIPETDARMVEENKINK